MQHYLRQGVLAVLCCLGLFAETARAWPDRSIELVVGFAPGGGTDITARTLATFLEKELGGTVVVVNKLGASGAIGLTYVARAKPDGHTLGMTNMPSLLTIPIEREAGYAPSDFTYLANLVKDPCAFSVSVNSPYKTLAELVAAARAHPGKVSVSTSGIGTDDHLQMVFFEKATGTKLNHVPFNGSAPQRTAVFGGHTDVTGMNLGEAMPYSQTNLRILAQAAEVRSILAPGVPTFKEQGVDVVLASERGVVGPKGLPPEVAQKLERALSRIAQNPEFIEQTRAQFTEIDYLGSVQWQERLSRADRELRELWKTQRWAD